MGDWRGIAFCGGLTSHPRGKGVAIIPSRFMLQKLKSDAGLGQFKTWPVSTIKFRNFSQLKINWQLAPSLKLSIPSERHLFNTT